MADSEGEVEAQENSEEVENLEEVSAEEVDTSSSVDTSGLIKQLAEVQAIADKNYDSYMRAAADLENYKRRASREKDDLRKAVAGKFVESMLPALDCLVLGLESAKAADVDAGVLEGFQMVYDRMRAALIEDGLEEINPEGGEFDPNTHECMSLLPNDEVEENHVIQVVRVGYSLGGRLLRPASVIVSRGKVEA